MKINRYLLILFIIALAILSVYTIYIYQKDKTATTDTTSSKSPVNSSGAKEGSDTTNFTFDVLQAMHYYYFSTQEQSAKGEEVSTMLVNMMTSMMNSVNRLESGNKMVDSYLNSDDELVKLIAAGMTTGANVVIEAENEFIEYLKNVDESDPNTYDDIEYQLAKRNASEKEGYSTIAISAAQIGYLFFEPAQSENPSGPIPYKVSKQERERILKEVDRLFGEELEEYKNSKGDVNTIIFGVSSIRNLLIPDTYEEAK